MNIHNKTVGTWRGAAIGVIAAATVAAGAGTAHAQACDDEELKVLSNDWFLSKIDCIADQGISAGKGLLTDAARNLAATGLDRIVPGLGSLLTGTSDPFAAHAAAIISRIDAAERNLIQTMVNNVQQEFQLDMAAVTTTLIDYANDDFATHVTNADPYDALVYTLRRSRQALQWPEALYGSHYDVAALGIEDVPRLHSVVTALGLASSTHPTASLVEAYQSFQVHTGYSQGLDALSDLEHDQIIADGAAEAFSDLWIDLEGDMQEGADYGFLDYLWELSRRDLFRAASDARFSPVPYRTFHLRSSNGCPDHKTPITSWDWRYTVEGVHGSYQIVWVPDFSGCGMPRIIEYSGQGTLSLRNPSGTVIRTEPVSGPNVPATVNAWVDKHKDDSYMEFIRSSYGAVRPTITDLIEPFGGQPDYQIDLDLMRSIDGDPRAKGAIDTLVSTLSSTEALSDADRRRLYDLVLAEGSDRVLGLAWMAWLLDPFHVGGIPIREYRNMLSNGVADADVGAHFQSYAAAKIQALL